MKFVVIGLSITSSWGNGHATTYRALLKELAKAGHDVLFLEKDVPYYASNRDLPDPDFCTVRLYTDNSELKDKYAAAVRQADVVLVGSYVQDGADVGTWVSKTAQGIKAFYDIDTPVTLAKLEKGDHAYLSPALIPAYDLYLSFTGGPILEHLEKHYGSPCARALYCSVDPEYYYPEVQEQQWDLGYLGTYSIDRQPTLEALLITPAREMPAQRFVVAGPQYPQDIQWPGNVRRIDHLNPSLHRGFYNAQKFTLNVTRADMIQAGYSPSVRLFEAAACGVPIISDYWEGLTSLFENETEILIAKNQADVKRYLTDVDDRMRMHIGDRARKKIMDRHTGKARALELIGYVQELKKQQRVLVQAEKASVS